MALSKTAQMFANAIKRGSMSIDDVPSVIRDQVVAYLEEMTNGHQ